MIQWSSLSQISQLEDIAADSFNKPILIFKHSTRCSISYMSKMRLEADWRDLGITPYFLDLIAFREISNAVADKFQVYHESPQVLLIVNEECIYESSHLDISVGEIEESLQYHMASNG